MMELCVVCERLNNSVDLLLYRVPSTEIREFVDPENKGGNRLSRKLFAAEMALGRTKVNKYEYSSRVVILP